MKDWSAEIIVVLTLLAWYKFDGSFLSQYEQDTATLFAAKDRASVIIRDAARTSRAPFRVPIRTRMFPTCQHARLVIAAIINEKCGRKTV